MLKNSTRNVAQANDATRARGNGGMPVPAPAGQDTSVETGSTLTITYLPEAGGPRISWRVQRQASITLQCSTQTRDECDRRPDPSPPMHVFSNGLSVDLLFSGNATEEDAVEGMRPIPVARSREPQDPRISLGPGCIFAGHRTPSGDCGERPIQRQDHPTEGVPDIRLLKPH